MSALAKAPSDNQKILPPSFGRIKRWLVFLLTVILLLCITLAWQVFYQQQTGLLVGRPLSSSQTHLHDVVFSSRPGVVYLGTHFGLFTSTDGGRTWPQRQGMLSTTMVTAIAVSPTNPDLLAVLAIPTSGIGRQAGVYMSADAGKHWRFTLPTGLSAPAYPYSLQASVGAGGHFFVFFVGSGWFETNDLGQHWSSLTRGNLATLQNPTLLTDSQTPMHLLMGGDQGLFETRNDGRSWQQIPSLQGSVLSLVATQSTRDQTRVIVCATDQGFYRGLEQGSRIVWSSLPTPIATPATRLVTNADGSALYALFGSDLWFSGDQGKTWRLQWRFVRSDLISLALNPYNPQELLAGFFWPGLVMISTNAGISWHTLTN